MSRQDRVGKTATSIREVTPFTYAVRYHNTDVVTYNAEKITLRTGGWKTVTTKLRMNQASRQFDLGYGVSQRKGVWYVRQWHKVNQKWINEKEFVGEEFIIER